MRTLILSVIAALAWSTPSDGSNAPDPGGYDGHSGRDGADSTVPGLPGSKVIPIPGRPERPGTAPGRTGGGGGGGVAPGGGGGSGGGGSYDPNAPAYQYRWDDSCPDNVGDPDANSPLCRAAITACPPHEGPLITIYRRQVRPAVTDWEKTGTACNVADVPADTPIDNGPPVPPPPPPKPVLTMAMIEEAFHHTPFTEPTLSAQPVGNATLVRLPVFVQLDWPTSGFQPGEVEDIDPATMNGYRVRIKPVLKEARYDFGDGTVIGSTTSLGGPYPSGDVKHAYPRKGVFSVNVTVTYRGEASVNGGPFVPIDGEVTRTSPLQPITVKTANNVLTR